MILKNINYRYDLKKAKMKNFDYTFIFDEIEFSNENLIQLIKDNFNLLENLIKNNFFNGNFKKEEKGTMTPNYLYSGNTYIRDNQDKFLQILRKKIPIDFQESVDLEYNIHSWENKINDFSITLNSSSGDKDSLYSLYDSIIKIPDLEFSDASARNIDNINILRSGNFDPKNNLELLIGN